MRWISLIILIICCLNGISQQNVESISTRSLSENWTFKNVKQEQWLSATVPGVVQSDLLALDMIPHPWIGTNEDSIQWIEEEDWVYRTYFDLTNQELDFSQTDMILHGLDTYATVLLNGDSILVADNMFCSWEINVDTHLKKDSNELVIYFHSPLRINRPKLKDLGYQLPAGSESVKDMVSPFTRKAPYHFGWDWGPRIVTCGIWKPIELIFWDQVKIYDVQFNQTSLTDSVAQIEVILDLDINKSEVYHIQIFETDTQVYLSSGHELITIPFSIEEPKRWWPNGWGDPYLYEINVTISSNDQLIDSRKESIGLRSIELLQEKNHIGTSFQFVVNSEPIFAKGANYIPQSHFLPSVTQEDYKNLLQAAHDANFNMLRVWGGGIYEQDVFYDLCDQLGIMVWQDFMFAGSMYPGDDAFISNVEHEIEDNVKRLRNHPSIAIWNGNNEMEVAWKNWGWQSQYGYTEADSTKIWNDYLNLFHDLIPNKLNRLDPQRPYTTTSPLSNWGTMDNFNHGSMHYWGVWHGTDRLEDYNVYVGRFMAEYGFQSFPNMKTIEFYADSSDYDLESKVMRHHQKSYIGNGLIQDFVDEYIGKIDGFEDFVNKSQQTQALAMQIAIDAHRLRKGHCWGTLFWQLNDCWPGPSWSSIDVFGNKKLLFNELEKLYAPFTLIPNLSSNQLSITAVNDKLEDMEGELKLQLMNRDIVLWSHNESISVKANGIKNVFVRPTKKIKKYGRSNFIRIQFIQNEEVIFERNQTIR